MRRLFSSTTFLLVFLIGCASAPPPKEVFYRFSADTAAKPVATALKGTARVERLKAEGILSERPILFSQAATPDKIEQYRYHLWSEPPSTLLTQLLLSHLQKSNIAEEVVDADLRTPVEYSVDGNIFRLERVINKGNDQAVVELRLRLLEFKSRKLLMQNRYLESVEIKGETLADVTQAMSLAVSKIYNRFSTDISALSASTPSR